jgi:NAD(P)-dependent dehydrogenase (short-subunit alcohol dehydrogenase family)
MKCPGGPDMRLVIGGSSGFGHYFLQRSLEKSIETYSTIHSSEIPDDLNIYNKKKISDIFFKCDLASYDSTENFVNKFQNTVKSCNQVVFCASLQSNRKKFLEVAYDEFLASFRVNFLSTVQILQKITPMLMLQESPSIVIVLSKAARTGGYRIYPYSSAKSALNILSKSLSREYAEMGIRLNTVSPGPLVENALPNNDYPLGSPTTFAQLYNTIEFLLSEESSGITGHDFLLDGGR